MILDLKKTSPTSYVKNSTLGSGSFGTTFLVSNNGKNYVLKEIKLNSKNISEIFGEVNVLNKVAKYGCRPSLLCFKEYFIDADAGTLNIVTEAFENCITLKEFILKCQKEKPKHFLSHKDLLKIFKSLLDALYFLHKIGVAHGDIKPENILIDKNLNTQLIDFGLSCTKHCKPSGTLLFASPEILKLIGSKSDISIGFLQTADVFSMGIVFYLLANLQFPFTISGNNPYENSSLTSESFVSPGVLDINTNSPLTTLRSLYLFYKSRGHVIFSFYNFNRTPFDERINQLIENMLTIPTKGPHARPSSKHASSILKRIITQFNKDSTTPIALSPESAFAKTPESTFAKTPESP